MADRIAIGRPMILRLASRTKRIEAKAKTRSAVEGIPARRTISW